MIQHKGKTFRVTHKILYMVKLDETMSAAVNEKWNSKERFNRDFELDGADDPLISANLEERVVNVRCHHKMGEKDTPFFPDPETLDDLVEKMENRGFKVDSTEGAISFSKEDRPKFYYYEKNIDIPETVETVEELFDLIQEQV